MKILKSIKLYIFNEPIVWFVNYISVELKKYLSMPQVTLIP